MLLKKNKTKRKGGDKKVYTQHPFVDIYAHILLKKKQQQHDGWIFVI